MLAIARRTINLYNGLFKDILKAIFLNKLIAGEETELFEKKLSQFIGSKHLIAISSGRAALKIILETLNLPVNTEIILPAYTAEEVPGIIQFLGYKPVFIDINDTDHNIDSSPIERNLTPKTKVIIATHIFGIPCDMEKILSLAQKYNLYVIEDCAHAIGATYKNKTVGNFGIAAFYSFANSKPFNTLGGGAISTNNDLLAEKIRNKVRNLPEMSKTALFKSILISYTLYWFTKPVFFTFFIYPFLRISGFFKKDFTPKAYSVIFKRILKPARKTARFSNLQAIAGLKQIERYSQYCEQTKKKFKILYRELFKFKYLINNNNQINTVPYFFVILTESADKLSYYLLKNGIDTGKYIMRHCPKEMNDKKNYPNTEKALKLSIQIPLHKFVDINKTQKIAEIINNFTLKNS